MTGNCFRPSGAFARSLRRTPKRKSRFLCPSDRVPRFSTSASPPALTLEVKRMTPPLDLLMQVMTSFIHNDSVLLIRCRGLCRRSAVSAFHISNRESTSSDHESRHRFHRRWSHARSVKRPRDSSAVRLPSAPAHPRVRSFLRS